MPLHTQSKAKDVVHRLWFVCLHNKFMHCEHRNATAKLKWQTKPSQNTWPAFVMTQCLTGNFNTASEFTSGGGIGVGYQIGATLNWNLFDGGRADAQVNQFKADQAIAEARFEQDARQARYDVEESYINQQSRLKQIDTATKAVEQAQEALRLARLRLDAGVGTQLEVITAESDLTRADVNRVQAIIGYNQSRANLERAVSGL